MFDRIKILGYYALYILTGWDVFTTNFDAEQKNKIGQQTIVNCKENTIYSLEKQALLKRKLSQDNTVKPMPLEHHYKAILTNNTVQLRSVCTVYFTQKIDR